MGWPFFVVNADDQLSLDESEEYENKKTLRG